MALLHPSSELVALAWATAVTSIPAGLALPEDYTTWADTGYITAQTVGGSPQVHMPVREPVVQLSCWAADTDSTRPPWLHAAQLVEVLYAAMRPTTAKRQVDPNTVAAATGNTYLHAHVQSIYALTEPRPVLGDEAAYARYQVDVHLAWVEAAS